MMLNTQQEQAVELVKEGKTFIEAARIVGYARPADTAKAFEKNLEFLQAVVPSLQKRSATWVLLVERAKKRVDLNLILEHQGLCRVYDDEYVERMFKAARLPLKLADLCSCAFGKIRAADGNGAAKIVIDTVSKMDPASLQGKAQKADEEEKSIIAARLIGTPENPDRDEDTSTDSNDGSEKIH